MSQEKRSGSMWCINECSYIDEVGYPLIAPREELQGAHEHTDAKNGIADTMIYDGLVSGTLVLHACGDAIVAVISILAGQGHCWKDTGEFIEANDQLDGFPNEAFFAFDTDAVGIIWFENQEDISLDNYLIAEVATTVEIRFPI